MPNQVKIIATADLHYEFADSSRQQTEQMAELVNASKADVLIIAGDTFAYDVSILDACLSLFSDFPGRKLITAGNHDLWVERNASHDSYDVYSDVIPSAAERNGFHYLDESPLVVGGVGFVGGMGWYDYSFRRHDLRIPLRFYEHKVSPGVAWTSDAYRHLLKPMNDVDPRMLLAFCMWNDGVYVRWDFNDSEFTDSFLSRLEQHIEHIENEVKTIVCATHHIPFQNMLKVKDDPSWSFGNAFMGSARIGDLLLRHPKVSYSICGHSHTFGYSSNGRVKCVNIGGDYGLKRFIEIDLAVPSESHPPCGITRVFSCDTESNKFGLTNEIGE